MKGIRGKRAGALLLAGVLAAGQLLGGCGKKAPLYSPGNPVNLTVWHYYNGPQMAAFDAQAEEFNSTVGKEKGIWTTARAPSQTWKRQPPTL